MASLLAGEEIYGGVRKPEINQLATGPLRGVIKAAISIKSQRPRGAKELGALLDSARAT